MHCSAPRAVPVPLSLPLSCALLLGTVLGQSVPQLKNQEDLASWLHQQLAAIQTGHDAATRVAVFPPLVGTAKDGARATQAGEYVVDLVLAALPTEWTKLAGDDLVQAIRRYEWGPGDYAATAAAEGLGIAASCDLAVGGSLVPNATGVRLELLVYDLARTDANKPSAADRFACDCVFPRTARDNEFRGKILLGCDKAAQVAFGAGAPTGGRLDSIACSALFDRMLEDLVTELVARVTARGFDARVGQLGVFPVLQGPDVPIRQFSKRIDQVLYATFENAMAAKSLHELLRRRNSSLLYYSVDPIEPGLLDELARERDIHGFLRGEYAYVAGSGRAVVTLELHDQACKQVARVRRVLGDRRLADWMNTVLDKDLTADEAAAYSFPEPDVSIDLVQDELVRVAGSALSEAAKKLGGKPDAESRPFFLRPAMLPGSEQEEETFKRLYQQLDDAAGRAIEAGARQGFDPAKSLDTVPVEIGGEQFANYRRAYCRIVEQIGTAFECSNGQLFRVQVTKYLFDQLIEKPPVEGLDLVAPPGIAEGEFTVDDTTVLVQPVVRIDGGKLTCLVRVIDANRPNRVLVQRSVVLPRQLTNRLQPQLEARTRDRTAPRLTPYLQKLLTG